MRALCRLLLLSTVACGKKVPTDPPPHTPDSPLKARLSTYQSLQDTVRDSHGFVDADQCDSLLFTALSSFHKTVDLRAAFDPLTGQWHRTPAKDCYTNFLAGLKPDSKASISREMLLGAMWYAYIHKDVDIANSIYDYATQHNWVMGDGVPSRTLMSTSLMATLAQLIYKLGGSDHTERLFPVTWLPGASGYERHVQAWHILLRMRLYDTIEESAPARLKTFVESQPDNPLYQYAVGSTDLTTQLLLDTRYYPEERLPTSADRCESWLIQRDSTDVGYQPCPEENRTHSGGELLAIGFLMTEGL